MRESSPGLPRKLQGLHRRSGRLAASSRGYFRFAAAASRGRPSRSSPARPGPAQPGPTRPGTAARSRLPAGEGVRLPLAHDGAAERPGRGGRDGAHGSALHSTARLGSAQAGNRGRRLRISAGRRRGARTPAPDGLCKAERLGRGRRLRGGGAEGPPRPSVRPPDCPSARVTVPMCVCLSVRPFVRRAPPAAPRVRPAPRGSALPLPASAFILSHPRPRSQRHKQPGRAPRVDLILYFTCMYIFSFYDF